ncbi:MAG: YoaK family protein [Pseudobdellovibrionaceae bacterium]
MFRGSRSLADYDKKNAIIWLSLAFQAGAINAGGFLACHRFVTHTTGFATHFGAEAAQGHWVSALGMLSVPLFFLLGSMTSGFFVDHRLAHSREPHYSWSFGLMFLTMLFVTVAGHNGVFGEFGAPLNMTRDYLLLALLCWCSGLQNATMTSASGAVVRTTHLTGLTTDLGIGLVRALSHINNDQVRKNEVLANWMRIGLIGAFILGSFAASFVFLNEQYSAFAIPALISLVLTVVAAQNRWQT